MNKELLKLLDSINQKKLEVQNLVNEGKLEEAKAAKEELKNLQDKFDLLKDVLDTQEPAPPRNTVKPVDPRDSVAEFANAARHGFRVQNSMTEGSPEDGGYTVPEDIQTQINTYREARFSLIDLVDVEPVTTNKGSRTYKKRSQQTGFSKVGEGGKIGPKPTPKFERMDYEIGKYAGWFPVTNELLADSDANITRTLVEWIGNESRVTRNNIIRDTIAQKPVVELTSLDDIKKALNVTLGAAFKSTSRVITNDDGLQYLDTLKDSDGQYLLQPNPQDPMQLRLCAGATIVPLEVIPNADMPSNTSVAGKRQIPFIIGDLKEGIKFFDRQRTTIMSSNIAMAGDLNAFEEDLTLFRAIEREDCRVKDDEAFVNGELVVGDSSVEGETISPDLVTLPATSKAFYGKNAGDMVTGATVYADGSVTGTFHYVTGYTGFNGSKTEEQEGYFFPFTLAKSGTKMTFKKNGKATKSNIAWEADNVFRVTAADTFTVLVDGEEVVTFNFSQATFEPKA